MIFGNVILYEYVNIMPHTDLIILKILKIVRKY